MWTKSACEKRHLLTYRTTTKTAVLFVKVGIFRQQNVKATRDAFASRKCVIIHGVSCWYVDVPTTRQRLYITLAFGWRSCALLAISVWV